MRNEKQFNNAMWGGHGNQSYNLNATVDTSASFLSKIALVLSILSFICCCIDWLFSIPAVICGIIALIKNKRDVCAWAAIIISSISLVFYIIALIVGAFDSLTESVSPNNNKVTTTVENSNSSKNDKEPLDEVTETKPTESVKKPEIYHIGETLNISTENGDYELTITGVKETDERNPFSEEPADRVIIIDYEFKNISYEESYGDYYNNQINISEMNFNMYDADGNALDTYPATTKYAQSITPGHKSSGQMAYALNNDKNFIEAEYYDNMFLGSTLVIELEW